MELKGLPVSEGVSIGPVYRYTPLEPNTSRRTLEPSEIPQVSERYQLAKRRAQDELVKLQDSLLDEHPDKAAIFEAHLDILLDVTIDEEILFCIEQERCSEDWAIQSVYTQYADALADVDDPLIQERAADIRDVCLRLLRCNSGETSGAFVGITQPSIILAHDLLPSDTATLKPELTLGIITEQGGETSHSAIIARGYGIPAVLGVEGAMSRIQSQDPVILDATEGVVIVNPTPQELSSYESKRSEVRNRQASLQAFLHKKPLTLDSASVEVHLNIGSATLDELAAASYTDGVGLFRTEFLFMQGSSLPTEEQQLEAYAKVFDAFGSKPVIIRTLDIGGDKYAQALDLPEESNPFLGNRALRLCFSRPELFHTQLRACLRAGAGHSLHIMFPMVGSLEEIRQAKQAVDRAKESLLDEGLAFAHDYKIGVMIEIPSLAIMSAEVAALVDFASIGSNDLTQYLLAADRLNPAVARYYQTLHPAVFRLISHVAQEFIRQGKPLSVCGELAGNYLAVPVLLGMGIRKLSMSVSSVAAVKKTICNISIEQAKAMAQQVCLLSESSDCERYLKSQMKSILDS